MRTLFFDLFWTLIQPVFTEELSENRIIGLSKEEWIKINEDPRVADERYLGKVESELEEIRRITGLLPFKVEEEKMERILDIRLRRIRKGLTEIRPEILETLGALKKRGHKICVISNADLMDVHFWSDCPMKDFFDQVFFSCDMGIIKPDRRIYEQALKRVGESAENCLYIGDGGSDELAGAHSVGMETVLAEHFVVKDKARREKILLDADHVIDDFTKLLELV